MSEGIFGRSLGKFKRFVAGALIGATLAFGMPCCSQNETGSSARVSSENIILDYGTSDSRGRFTFQAGEKQLQLTVKNRVDFKPVQGAGAVFVSDLNESAFFVFDPGKFHPSFSGVSGNVEQKETSTTISRALGLSDVKWTDFLYPVLMPPVIEFDLGLVPPRRLITQDLIPPGSLFNDFVYNNLFVSQGMVTLSELDYTLIDLIQELGENAASDELLKRAGVKLAFKIQAALLLSQIITDGHEVYWANYYRSLCYNETDRFEVLKFIFPDIPLLVDNPMLMVIPERLREGEDVWTPPTGKFRGVIFLSDGRPASRNSVIVQLHSLGSELNLPPIETITDDFGSFSIIASACSNHNTYALSAYHPTQGQSLECVGPFTLNNGDESAHDLRLSSEPHFDVPGRVRSDCRHLLNESSSTTCTNELYYYDADRDNLGDPLISQRFCTASDARRAWYVANSEDCYDDTTEKKYGYTAKEIKERFADWVPCESGPGMRWATCERGAWEFDDCMPLISNILVRGATSTSPFELPPRIPCGEGGCSPSCAEGEERNADCTVDARPGVRVDSCVAGAWVEGVCEPLAECAEGEEREVACTYAVGYEGVRTDSCVGGWWQAGWCHGTECTGSVEVTTSCTADGLPGVATTTCWNGWLVEQPCRAFECTEGEERTAECSVEGRAGSRTDSCASGSWVSGECRLVWVPPGFESGLAEGFRENEFSFSGGASGNCFTVMRAYLPSFSELSVCENIVSFSLQERDSSNSYAYYVDVNSGLSVKLAADAHDSCCTSVSNGRIAYTYARSSEDWGLSIHDASTMTETFMGYETTNARFDVGTGRLVAVANGVGGVVIDVNLASITPVLAFDEFNPLAGLFLSGNEVAFNLLNSESIVDFDTVMLHDVAADEERVLEGAHGRIHSFRNGKIGVPGKVFDVATGTETTLPSGVQPDVYGNYAVYDDMPASRNWDVFIRNLDTGATTNVTNSPDIYELSPRIYSSNVVFFRIPSSTEEGEIIYCTIEE